MSGRVAARAAKLGTLISVGPWRNCETGEETGDLIILFEVDGKVGRMRLADSCAATLADAIGPVRATIADRRKRAAEAAEKSKLRAASGAARAEGGRDHVDRDLASASPTARGDTSPRACAEG
ncbi:hypothetical protein A1351_20260 [Methylosinus sp. R-45379]|uniref:hypothetical protein n=1 Tax=Methylosinus sp. R-45379 TaxID=980563 RepID=UPI0007C8D8C1|nr:hypothetical protein [Methylosinus sp. R-45379]OAI22904.1 hypothetical protein A1351_20260 [Methylosinus sp. R-45379]